MMNGRESSLSTPAIPSLVYFASGFITAIASVSLMGYMTKKSLKSTIKKSEPRSHEFYSKSHEKERLVDGQLESRTAKRREDFSDSDRNTQQKQKEAPSFSASEDDKIIIDTPYLSHRIIRKAEAVIRFRTSRFLVVIERCTDDHNYSAILRTVGKFVPLFMN